MIKNNKNYYADGNIIYVKSFMDGYYFEKNGIIVDFKCPNCKTKILSSNNLCKCGYSLKNEDKKTFWISLLLSWLITGLIIVGGFFAVEKSKNLFINKLTKNYSYNNKI
jgi:hypothetical protein